MVFCKEKWQEHDTRCQKTTQNASTWKEKPIPCIAVRLKENVLLFSVVVHNAFSFIFFLWLQKKVTGFGVVRKPSETAHSTNNSQNNNTGKQTFLQMIFCLNASDTNQIVFALIDLESTMSDNEEQVPKKLLDDLQKKLKAQTEALNKVLKDGYSDKRKRLDENNELKTLISSAIKEKVFGQFKFVTSDEQQKTLVFEVINVLGQESTRATRLNLMLLRGRFSQHAENIV